MNDIRDYKRRVKRHEKRMKRKERWSAINRRMGRFKAFTIGFLFLAVIMGEPTAMSNMPANGFMISCSGTVWIVI